MQPVKDCVGRWCVLPLQHIHDHDSGQAIKGNSVQRAARPLCIAERLILGVSVVNGLHEQTGITAEACRLGTAVGVQRARNGTVVNPGHGRE